MTPGVSSSKRHDDLLELSYGYVLEHGLSDLSLRPLAKAVGSSPRVLLFLFGSKDGLVRALLGRARQDELAFIAEVRSADEASLAAVANRIWTWLAASEHRDLLVLWAESYARSLVEPDGPWGGFAAATVHDWLDLFAQAQSPELRASTAGETQRTMILAALRGALLDLLATGDVPRTTASIKLATHQSLNTSIAL